MSTFVFAYRAPAGDAALTPEAMAAWQRFFDGLGSKLVDAGNPVFSRNPVGNCGPGTVLGGYSVVTADDLQEAAALARTCPALGAGGGVEVGELTRLSASTTVTSADDHARATRAS